MAKTPLLALFVVVTHVMGILANYVQNPSFEKGTGSWMFHERKSLWDYQNAGENCVQVSNDTSMPGGKNSLVFRKCQTGNNKNQEVLIASQYLDIQSEGGLQVSFWVSGVSPEINIHLDIAYSNGADFTVKLTSSKLKRGIREFQQICAFIPGYGRVRATMLHLITNKLTEPVFVDDVSLIQVKHPHNSCQVYVDRFPQNRQVEPGFLSPQPDPRTHLSTQALANASVTLCTHLIGVYDMDKLELLAKSWRGPVSAAVLVFFQPYDGFAEGLRILVQKYYSSAYLRLYVTMHIIYEDLLTMNDESLPPVDYLRSIQVLHAKTPRVLSVDLETVVPFTAKQAQEWLTKVKPSTSLALCMPTFTTRNKDGHIPTSKEDLLQELKANPHLYITKNMGPQSALIQVKWTLGKDPFLINASLPADPSCILPRYAGMSAQHGMHDPQWRASDAEIYMLPEAYLLQQGGKKSMHTAPWQRMHGLGVFLTSMLRDNLHRSNVSDTSPSLNAATQGEEHAADEETCHREDSATHMRRDNLEKSGQSVRAGDAEEYDDHNWRVRGDDLKSPETLHDTFESISCDTSLHHNTPWEVLKDTHSALRASPKSSLVEDLMKLHGTYLYIQLPNAIAHNLHQMLPFMHPDGAVSVLPDDQKTEHGSRGIHELYRSKMNASLLLAVVKSDHPQPALISIDAEGLGSNKAVEYVQAVTQRATVDDVILLQGCREELPLDVLQREMCRAQSKQWRITRKAPEYLILKSDSLKNAHQRPIPPAPPIVAMTHIPACSEGSTQTDVVMVTRNRPVQTYAFLESLHQTAKHVHKVWLLMRADSDLIKHAYNITTQCFSQKFEIETVIDESGEFGNKILEILERSMASNIMFAVDEMIWLQPFDFSYLSCLLHSDKSLASIQLRLGENLSMFQSITKRDQKFHPLTSNKDMYAFYPRGMPFDFGYVLNVDGIVMRKADILLDWRDILPKVKRPGELETRWIMEYLPMRSKQWHLMFKESRTVNNNGLPGGRVAMSVSPSQETEDIVSMFINDRKKVDVVKFIQEHSIPRATHTAVKFELTDFDCTGH